MEQLLTQIQDVFLNLFNSQALMATLAKPEIMLAAFIALNIIIFTETGLLIGFFLPGDSLLVTAGIVAWGSNWPLHWLIPTLCLSAIVGDSVPICLHENGPIPDPALLGSQADWLWFMTWHTRWLMDSAQNDPGRLKAYYAAERYLTKDELKWAGR